MHEIIKLTIIVHIKRGYMSIESKKFVEECIKRLVAKDYSYYESCINQRLYNGGMGSFYDKNVDFIDVMCKLINVDWEEVTHPNVQLPCRCFKCDNFFTGYVGMVELEKLSDDVELFFSDFKNTGKLSLCVKESDVDVDVMKTNTTYLITGDDGYGPIVFTFHPGEPLKPSTLEDGTNSYGVKKNDSVTKEMALKMGFKHVKVSRGV